MATAAGGAERPMSEAEKVGYLQTVVQLADRDLAQLVASAELVRALGVDGVARVQRTGVALRRGLDVIGGHGAAASLLPCFCSRHWRPDVPLKA